jgi:hypothetical protein
VAEVLMLIGEYSAARAAGLPSCIVPNRTKVLDVRFDARKRLKSDIAPCPKSADFVAEVSDDDGEGRERDF